MFSFVYSEQDNKLVHLQDPKDHPLGELLQSFENLDFLGEQIESETLRLVVKGEFDLTLNQPINFLNLSQYKEDQEIVDFQE